jgi:hypothetical protein
MLATLPASLPSMYTAIITAECKYGLAEVSEVAEYVVFLLGAF